MAYHTPGDEPQPNCKHLPDNAETRNIILRAIKQAEKIESRCSACGKKGTVWCCLTCQHIGCGRRMNQHALQHAKETKHLIALNMHSGRGNSPITLYCYACDMDLMLFDDNDDTSANNTTDEESNSDSMDANNNHNNDNNDNNPHNNNNNNMNNMHTRTRNQSGSQSIPITRPSAASLERAARRGIPTPDVPSPSDWKSADEILTSTPIWTEYGYTGGTVGLANLGNTCFLNSSLQALLHCPPIIYMLTIPEILHVKKMQTSRAKLVENVVEIAHAMWGRSRSRYLVPRNLIRNMMYLFPQFRGYGQQDAHEFLSSLLNHMHEQFSYTLCEYEQAAPSKSEDGDASETTGKTKDEEKSDESGKKRLKIKSIETTSMMQDIFGGQLVSEVECCECGNRSTNKEMIWDLSVEIPKPEQIEKAVKERDAQPLPQQSWVSSFLGFVGLSKQSIPLDLCMHSYCTSEELQQSNLYNCEKCKRKVEAKKSLHLSHLPEVLMIQIKRFSHSAFWNSGSKVSTHVEFPISNLDMRQYIHRDFKDSEHNRESVYDLYSIVKHSGGTGGGHYVSYAKHPATGLWYYFDDTHCTKVTPQKVQEQQAYILFYVRRRQRLHNIQSIQKLLQMGDKRDKTVQLSRYWLHRIVSFSRTAPIDNLWLSCYHGHPLPPSHERRDTCSIKISRQAWDQLVQQFGTAYNCSLLQTTDTDAKYAQQTSQTSQTSETSETAETSEKTSEQSEITPNGDAKDLKDKEKRGSKVSKESKDPHAYREKDERRMFDSDPWEDPVKAKNCIDCEQDGMEHRRQYEKLEIQKLEKEGRPQDSVVSMEWANKWREFVHGRSDSIPGPLDNRSLDGKDGYAKPGLTSNTDYLLVPTPIWFFLIELYGGGPKLLPRPLENSPEIETASEDDTEIDERERERERVSAHNNRHRHSSRSSHSHGHHNRHHSRHESHSHSRRSGGGGVRTAPKERAPRPHDSSSSHNSSHGSHGSHHHSHHSSSHHSSHRSHHSPQRRDPRDSRQARQSREYMNGTHSTHSTHRNGKETSPNGNSSNSSHYKSNSRSPPETTNSAANAMNASNGTNGTTGANGANGLSPASQVSQQRRSVRNGLPNVNTNVGPNATTTSTTTTHRSGKSRSRSRKRKSRQIGANVGPNARPSSSMKNGNNRVRSKSPLPSPVQKPFNFKQQNGNSNRSGPGTPLGPLPPPSRAGGAKTAKVAMNGMNAMNANAAAGQRSVKKLEMTATQAMQQQKVNSM